MAIHQIPKGQSAKLYDKATCPYLIVALGPNYTYQLRRCSDNKLHPNLINAIHLKRYYDPNTLRNHRPQVVPGPMQPRPMPPQSPTGSPKAAPGQQRARTGPNPSTSGVKQPCDRPVQSSCNPTPSSNKTNHAPSGQVGAALESVNSTLDPNKKYAIVSTPSAKFLNGKRLIRVVWEDGSRTWEPKESFDPDYLAYLNTRFTKTGQRSKDSLQKSPVQMDHSLSSVVPLLFYSI